MHREMALDSWRGLMLVVMAVVHLGGRPAGMVGEVLGFASAAEGFVFLSGVMCGLVYGRYGTVSAELMWARDLGPGRDHLQLSRRDACAPAALHRAAEDAAGRPCGVFRANQPGAVGGRSDPRRPRGHGAGAQPVHFDILPLYVLYMGLAPFMLELFARGRSAEVFAGARPYGCSRSSAAATW